MSVPGDVPIDEVAVVYGWMHRLCNSDRAIAEVASTKVVCDGPGDQRALNVEAATA
jgi:hypothetical protein